MDKKSSRKKSNAKTSIATNKKATTTKPSIITDKAQEKPVNPMDLPVYLFHQGTNYEAYRLLCPHVEMQNGTEGWVFRVWAPQAKSVSVVGDWCYWDRSKHPMHRISVGLWEAFVVGAHQWDAYRYSVETQDGRIVDKTDPYALHCETPPASAGKLVRLDYAWQDRDWMSRRGKGDVYNSPINIYEMHLGSWRTYPDGQPFDYRKMADELIPYLQQMHYTHVELLPVTEYPYSGSWGYQCTGMFAPTSRYGAPQDLMYLIDRCHQAGIGVIVDWVAAHFPKDSWGLARFDGQPLYEYGDPQKGEHPQWGTLIYDYGRNEVRSFLISSAAFWFDLYHVDGIRMDAVSSILYLDFGREPGQWTPNVEGTNINLEGRDFLKTLNNAIHERFVGALMIAEESTAYPLITKNPDLGGLGFDFKWNMGWMNDTLRYIKSDPLWRKDMHNNMTFGMMYAFKENYILALSHDEVVHGKGSLLNKQPGYYIDKFGGLMTYLSYMMAHPGKKLLFMGAEFGQFIEWDYHKGLDWFLLDYPTHKGLHEYVKDLNQLYLDEPCMYQQDCTYDGFEWLSVGDANWNILSWRRIAKNGDYIIVLLNFSPVLRTGYKLGVPEEGEYYTVLDSTSKRYNIGNTDGVLRFVAEEGEINGHPYHITLDVAPNSARFFKVNKTPNKEGEI